MPTDDDVVYENCRRAQAEGKEIDDATARVIASWYQQSRYPRTESFVSTGAILDSADQLWNDISWNGVLYDRGSKDQQLALDMLGTYLLNREDRGPVPGWSDLWVR